MKHRMRWSLALAAVLLTVSALAASAQTTQAYAVLKMANGQEVGTAVLTQQASAVKLTVNVSGLPAGKHGFHIHAVGKCDAPDFASAVRQQHSKLRIRAGVVTFVWRNFFRRRFRLKS